MNNQQLREHIPDSIHDFSSKISVYGVAWNQYTDMCKIQKFVPVAEHNVLIELL